MGDPGRGPMTFCIPVLAKDQAKDWGRVCELLTQTLASLENQSDRSLRVLIATHDPGELPLDTDLDLKVLEATWETGSESSEKIRDKGRKKMLLYRELRELGGGYAMQLDADDLVSRELVKYVRETDHPHGYILKSGYAFDWAAGKLAPIPGAFSRSFDSVCGSCAIIRFEEEDLPVKGDPNAERMYYRLKQHAHYAEVLESLDRPLIEAPFPAAVYVVNHDQNLHFTIATERVTRVPRQIRKHEIELTPELRREFMLPEPRAAQ